MPQKKMIKLAKKHPTHPPNVFFCKSGIFFAAIFCKLIIFDRRKKNDKLRLAQLLGDKSPNNYPQPIIPANPPHA